MVVQAVLVVRVGCSWAMAAMVVPEVPRQTSRAWVVPAETVGIPASWGGVSAVVAGSGAPAVEWDWAVMAVWAVRRACCRQSVVAVRVGMVEPAARPVVGVVRVVTAGLSLVRAGPVGRVG